MTARKFSLSLMILITFLAVVFAALGAGLPPDGWPDKPVSAPERETNIFKIFFSGALKVFQRHISPIDGPRCGFSPTCSEYSRQSIARYGLPRGLVMTSDRLQRCHYCATHYYSWRDGHLTDPPPANVWRKK